MPALLPGRSACFISYIYIYITDWLEVAHDTQSGIGNASFRLEIEFLNWKRDFKIRNKIFRLEARAINKDQKNYQISKLIICHELSTNCALVY